MCDREENSNVMHDVALTHRSDQAHLLAPMLEAWPDALKFCGEVFENSGSHPLHFMCDNRMCHHGGTVSGTTCCPSELLAHSTLEAVATALLQIERDGGSGF